MEPFDVREHSSTPLPFDLSADDECLLTDPLLSKYFRLRRTAKGWSVHVEGVTGVLRLDNRILRVVPKIAVSGEMLLHWLHYAVNRSHPTHSHTRPWDAEGTYFPDMVVTALLNECRTLVTSQLRKDYQRNESVDGVLRGRLDVAKQATRRFGMVDKLHVRTFDRTAEIWENQVCGAALRHAARTAESVQLRTRAQQLAARFPACSAEVARQKLARAQHNRLNERYRRAHTWAEVVLRSGGVSDLFLPRELVGDSHLLIMHRLWERIVHRMVDSERVQPVQVTRPGKQRENFPPDAVARAAGGLVAVDAKYKDYDNRDVTREDIHQLLTYASAYRLQDAEVLRAAIVHPSASKTARREITVDFGGRPLAVIDLIGVDVSDRPEKSSVVLRKLLQR